MHGHRVHTNSSSNIFFVAYIYIYIVARVNKDLVMWVFYIIMYMCTQEYICVYEVGLFSETQSQCLVFL